MRLRSRALPQVGQVKYLMQRYLLEGGGGSRTCATLLSPLIYPGTRITCFTSILLALLGALGRARLSCLLSSTQVLDLLAVLVEY